MQLSVIIPLAPQEQAWKALLPDLAALPAGSEIILACPQGHKPLEVPPPAAGLKIHAINVGRGRAAQMNAAASIAEGEHLWFVHADSRLTPASIPCLLARMTEKPAALLYYDLKFLSDATPLTRLDGRKCLPNTISLPRLDGLKFYPNTISLMRLTELGTWLRSRLLGIPFGDQALCLRADIFRNLGGYPQGLPYGEDHILVWRARQAGVPLHPVRSPLYSSPRKYRAKGWLNTTLRHLYLTFVQAWPEFWRLLLRRGPA